ncbi:MAG: PilZ domain-containing protein [Alphaproteobacteria bacterium]|nr:PilZ domain-containing protein [Alphaproteobacteria bacterium]
MPDLDDTKQLTGAERRREKRYQVELKGMVGLDGEIFPVRIGDLSGSGALLLMDAPPETGAVGDLWIEGFGDVEIKIMFSGDAMCGVMFTRPAECRDRLLRWLLEEVRPQEAPAA